MHEQCMITSGRGTSRGDEEKGINWHKTSMTMMMTGLGQVNEWRCDNVVYAFRILFFAGTCVSEDFD